MDMERDDFVDTWFDADLDGDFEHSEIHGDATEL